MDDTSAVKNAVVTVQLLGRFQLWKGNVEVALHRKHRLNVLLAYLACPPLRDGKGRLLSVATRRTASRAELMRVLWPEDAMSVEGRTGEQDRARLRRLLGDLQTLLEVDSGIKEGMLVCEGQDVSLKSSIATDLDAILPALHMARHIEPASRSQALLSLLSLFRGELLSGLDALWINKARADLATLYAEVLQELAELVLEGNQASPAAEVIQAARPCWNCLRPPLVALERCEACIMLLMRLHLHIRQPQEALAHYVRLEHIWPAEKQPSTAARKLRDEARIMARTFQPVRQRGPLIGRDTESRRLEQLLLAYAPLITLSGPPGVGKTRLAYAVLPSMADSFGQDVHFVALQALTDPCLIADAILTALSVERTATAPSEQLMACLASRPVLLVLDNFEHLLSCGGADVIEDLLAHLPLLSCLITSRERLRLANEVEFALAPLPVPDEQAGLDALLACPSAQVFALYARDARPSFAVTLKNAAAVGKLCRHLDGLPLALVLIAGWAGTYSPRQILEQLATLSNQPPPGARRQAHTSLQEVIAWSYRLLPAEQQHFFVCLSVFQDGWTLHAAQTVFGLPERQIVDCLADLQGKSLIIAQEAGQELRFSMLNTLQAFAVALTSEERAELCKRHAAYFLNLAKEACSHLAGPDQRPWLTRLREEYPNLQAALSWQARQGAAEDSLCFAASLGQFWLLCGRWQEGQRQIEQALAAVPITTPLRVEALNSLANLVRVQGDYVSLKRVALECLAVSRSTSHLAGVSMALNSLGLVARHQGKHALARWLYAYSQAIDRGTGDVRGEAVVLVNLGAIDWEEGNLSAARSGFERSLALCQPPGHADIRMGALNNLALVRRDQGDLHASRWVQLKCLRVALALGNQQFQAFSYNNLGILYRMEGDLRRSTRCLEKSLVIKRKLGLRKGVSVTLDNMGANVRLQGDYRRARAYLQESLCIEREIGSLGGMVESVEAFARLACCEGQETEAVTLFGCASKQRGALVLAPAAEEGSQDRQMLQALQARLGDEAFGTAWEQGQMQSLELAVVSCLSASSSSSCPHG